MMYTYLIFKYGKLVTVIQSIEDNINEVKGEQALLVDYDYIIKDPQEAEKQIAEWKSEHR